MKSLLMLTAILVLQEPANSPKAWPDAFQGAWELKIDWQVDSSGERKQLSNPTTYQVIVIEDELYLYHKSFHTIAAYRFLAFDDKGNNHGSVFCLAKCGAKRKAFKISANEIVFITHGNYPSTGFKLLKLDVEETKNRFKNLLEENAVLLDDRLLRFRGQDVKDFNMKLEFPNDLFRIKEHPRVVANQQFKDVIWFHGDAASEPLLRARVNSSD